MEAVYLQRLDDIHSEFSEKMPNEGATCAEKLNILKEEFSRYINIIHEFFTGKENVIREIYKAIRENSYPYNEIVCADIEDISNDYFSYFRGLKDFLEIMSDLKDTDDQDVEKVSNTIKNVISKDANFVSSLFNKTMPAKNLDSAMKNVEFLISVRDKMHEIINIAEYICGVSQASNSKTYCEAVNFAYSGFINSVRCYAYNTIKQIFITFVNIENSMKTRVSARQPEETPTLQIF